MDKISQLMDGELGPARDEDTRSGGWKRIAHSATSWDTYHLIRDALRARGRNCRAGVQPSDARTPGARAYRRRSALRAWHTVPCATRCRLRPASRAWRWSAGWRCHRSQAVGRRLTGDRRHVAADRRQPQPQSRAVPAEPWRRQRLSHWPTRNSPPALRCTESPPTSGRYPASRPSQRTMSMRRHAAASGAGAGRSCGWGQRWPEPWSRPRRCAGCSGSPQPPASSTTRARSSTSTAIRRRPRASRISWTATGEYEKLETLDGPQARDHPQQHRDPHLLRRHAGAEARERRRRASCFPALLPEQLSLLTQNYDLRKGGQERIAGLRFAGADPAAARRVPLRPQAVGRDQQRAAAQGQDGEREQRGGGAVPVHRDRTINAPLTRDRSAQLSAAVPAIDPRTPPQRSRDRRHRLDRPQPAGGFQADPGDAPRQAGRTGAVAHLVFSDGLAAVSVFIEPLPPSRRVGRGPSRTMER